MVFDFLQPISASVEEYIATLSNQTLGKKVVFHTQTDFPVLDNVAIAIITVNEIKDIGSKQQIRHKPMISPSSANPMNPYAVNAWLFKGINDKNKT